MGGERYGSPVASAMRLAISTSYPTVVFSPVPTAVP